MGGGVQGYRYRFALDTARRCSCTRMPCARSAARSALVQTGVRGCQANGRNTTILQNSRSPGGWQLPVPRTGGGVQGYRCRHEVCEPAGAAGCPLDPRPPGRVRWLCARRSTTCPSMTFACSWSSASTATGATISAKYPDAGGQNANASWGDDVRTKGRTQGHAFNIETDMFKHLRVPLQKHIQFYMCEVLSLIFRKGASQPRHPRCEHVMTVFGDRTYINKFSFTWGFNIIGYAWI